MRKRVLYFSVAALLFVLHIQVVQSQTTEFSYQGNLNSAGQPATGSYDFEFLLFDSLTGGSQVGSTAAINNVLVTNGVFSVKLNFGDQFPGANRYLEIRMRPTGQSGMTILSPRQLLNSTPYSVKSLNAMTSAVATNALNLGGVAANQYVLTTDPRMSDARPPMAGSPNYIQNGASLQASSSFNISNTGTADIFNATTQYSLGGLRVLANPGASNLFAGVGAGAANTSGSGNAFFGRAAGSANTTGSSNTFVGAGSGSRNTTGVNNSFFGSGAGPENTTGTRNSFFGDSVALSNTTGSSNVFVGQSSGSSNTEGSYNVFLGTNSGGANATGNYNIAIGYNTSAATGGNNNTVVGADTRVNSPSFNFASAIGAGAVAAASNSVTLGRPEGQDIVRIPGYLALLQLHTAGTVTLCRNAFLVVSTCSSSARYKSNINSFTPGLDLIRRLRPVRFKWKDGGAADIGLIAEEVNLLEPLLTTINGNNEVEGVKYDRLTVVLVNAVREQQSRLEAQQNQLNKEKARNLSLEERLAKQEAAIHALKSVLCLGNKAAAICNPRDNDITPLQRKPSDRRIKQ
ncbi:MAG TPA: tail fiber domain-containing protein [Pyrinomonadaceae bacterium]